jgi:hypothetical protein
LRQAHKLQALSLQPSVFNTSWKQQKLATAIDASIKDAAIFYKDVYFYVLIFTIRTSAHGKLFAQHALSTGRGFEGVANEPLKGS